MFVYGSDFFVLRPGLLVMALGLLLTVPLGFGPLDVGSITLSLYTMLFGLALTVVGFQSFCLGCIAQVLFDYTGRAKRRWMRLFPYTRTVSIAALLILAGIALVVPLVVHYVTHDFKLGAAGGRAEPPGRARADARDHAASSCSPSRLSCTARR